MRMLALEMSQVTLPNASIWPNLGSATIYWVLALILEAHSERHAYPHLLQKHYRNTSSAGTTAQLIKERETLSRMVQCSCCLCGGSCGASGSVVGLGPAAPSSLLDPEVPAPWGSNTDSKPAEEVEIAKQPLHQDCHQDPNTGGPKISACARPKEAVPAPTTGLPTPMQLKWRPLTNERPPDLTQWGTSQLSEAGPRMQLNHGKTLFLALPADPRFRSYRCWDPSTNFPTFAHR